VQNLRKKVALISASIPWEEFDQIAHSFTSPLLGERERAIAPDTSKVDNLQDRHVQMVAYKLYQNKKNVLNKN
jgi:hypothetical protein